MANFSSSNLVAAQARLQEEFTRPEMREKVLPALRLGVGNSGILIPGVTELRKREDRPVYAYAMKRQVRTPGSQRTATHTGNSGDSMQLNLTWNTYTDVFQISLKQMDNNIFGFNEAMAQNIKNCILNIHAQIESDTIAFLLAQRTQVVKNTNPIGMNRANWNTTNFAYEVDTDDQKTFVQAAKSIMFQNYYQNMPLDMICDGSIYYNAAFWQSQGAGNAQNTAFQFTGVNVAPSSDLADSNYPSGVALVMERGTFSLIDWIPRQNREGSGDYNSYTGGYGSFTDPAGTGLTFALHGYSLRADMSSYNSVAQDDQMQFEISVDVAQALTPLSTSPESVVYEIAQMA